MAGGEVLSDAANIHLVLARNVERSRVQLRVRVVLDDHGRGLAQHQPGIGRADLLRGLDENRFAVPDRYRHTYARRRDRQRRIMKDLAGLVDELHLLFVIAVNIWLPAAGDHVVGQLVRGGGYSRSLARGDGCRLLLQLIEQRSAGARCVLVAGDDDPTQTKLLTKSPG